MALTLIQPTVQADLKRIYKFGLVGYKTAQLSGFCAGPVRGLSSRLCCHSNAGTPINVSFKEQMSI